MNAPPPAMSPSPGGEAALRRERVIRAAVREGLTDPDEAVLAAFVDLDGVAALVAALRSAFPASLSVRHTFAAKANSLVPVLEHLRLHGMGCEVASAGELDRATAAGFGPELIVFDSPAKTRAELARALRLGVAVNVDNFQELERVDALLAANPSASPLGVRVNPQVGAGSIEAMSTATDTSKFGIALDDEGNRARLIDAFRERPWLTWLHTHVGSQGIAPELTARGLARTVELADEINSTLGRRQVVGIDIGGGLSVDFDSDDPDPGFDGYVAALRRHAPRLLSGDYRLVTEFGRALLAKNGFMTAFVEYTKTAGGRPVAITHAGAHVATRTVFRPDAWPLRVTAHDPSGRQKRGDVLAQDVAGPCCFAGDLLATARPLPRLAPGDLVAVLDTGAYAFSTPFHYNSLPVPAVYGFSTAADGEVRFRTLRPAGGPD